MPPFTMEAQQWIWERQNPPVGRCHEHKFLLGFVEVHTPGRRPLRAPASCALPAAATIRVTLGTADYRVANTAVLCVRQCSQFRVPCNQHTCSALLVL
jgi:hypothetical protein